MYISGFGHQSISYIWWINRIIHRYISLLDLPRTHIHDKQNNKDTVVEFSIAFDCLFIPLLHSGHHNVFDLHVNYYSWSLALVRPPESTEATTASSVWNQARLFIRFHCILFCYHLYLFRVVGFVSSPPPLPPRRPPIVCFVTKQKCKLMRKCP